MLVCVKINISAKIILGEKSNLQQGRIEKTQVRGKR
jgi:hypothetical protein